LAQAAGRWQQVWLLVSVVGVSAVASVPAVKGFYLGLLLLFNVFWGASLSIYITVAEVLTPAGIVTWRFGLASVFLLLAWPFLPGKAPRGRDLIRTLALGFVVFCLGHRLQVTGVTLGGASNASILMAFEPLVTGIGAAWFLKERIPTRRWIGFALSVVGACALNHSEQLGLNWVGLAAALLMLASFGTETAYSIVGKPIIERASPAKVVALSLLSGTLLNLALDGPASLRAAAGFTLGHWAGLLFLSLVCTSLGYVLWYSAIRHLDVNVAAMTIFLQPVAGLVAAFGWLGEPLRPAHISGSLMILGGLALGLFYPSRAAESLSR